MGRTRTPNCNPKLVVRIAQKLGLVFVPEKGTTPHTFAPIDILDYIYAVLHSNVYLEKYKEFLKSDFPYIPYPVSKEIFWQLVQLGSALRKTHLLESLLLLRNFIKAYPYPVAGDNRIQQYSFRKNRCNYR